jgi:hypothetical protein
MCFKSNSARQIIQDFLGEIKLKGNLIGKIVFMFFFW